MTGEIHEVPAGDPPGMHDVFAVDQCVCVPDVMFRLQNGLPLAAVVRHRTYTREQAQSTRFVRGF